MNRSPFIDQSRRMLASSAGYSLVELLIVMGLISLIAGLSVRAVLIQPTDAWKGVAQDYIHHLSAVYNKVRLQYGNTPVNSTVLDASPATTSSTRFSDGIGTVIQDWESIATYAAGPPRSMAYPSKITVYLDPENNSITDPNNELPINQAGNPATIMADTDNKEWLLLDMNGTEAPNSMNTSGDRVLLIVDDNTGRVLTAWQKCWFVKNAGVVVVPPTTLYGSGTTCTLNATAPSRTYYKSFYDVYQSYTGSY